MKITITDVHKRYGDVVALEGPSFEIPSGSTFGVLGTNGAGKTTLFELLVGYDTPDSGSIDVGGIDVERAGHRVRERVAFLPEHAGFPPSMTGREVLDVQARIRGLADRNRRIEDALETVGLTDAADRRVEGYSNGMGRRLGLAAALLAEPPVLVLDEPTAGLDPRGVATFHRTIERIDRETDATVVLSSHVLSEVERLCDAVAILEDGQLRATGTVDDLRGGGRDDRVTVVVEPAADGDRSAVLETVREYGDVRVGGGGGEDEGETGTDDEHANAGGPVELTCQRAAALECCRSLEGRPLDRFEVREPGLEAAFHEALADEHDGEDGSESEGKGEDEGETEFGNGSDADALEESEVSAG